MDPWHILRYCGFFIGNLASLHFFFPSGDTINFGLLFPFIKHAKWLCAVYKTWTVGTGPWPACKAPPIPPPRCGAVGCGRLPSWTELGGQAEHYGGASHRMTSAHRRMGSWGGEADPAPRVHFLLPLWGTHSTSSLIPYYSFNVLYYFWDI
jgi:hypothetical protein